MKAVAARDGKAAVIEVDAPELKEGHVLIRTEFSGISPGTEMGIIKNSAGKSVMIGYSAVGRIEQLGEGVTDYEIGDRVACYGSPFVQHAELLAVPTNLITSVPEHVCSQEAAFTGLGAIAIHALRIADLRFGESVLVVGLGILGNLVAQIASAAAYRTVGMDLSSERVELLKQQGLPQVFERTEDLEEQLDNLTDGHGFDSIILCAGGSGEELINSSFEWLRDRGSVVIVGNLSMEFSRAAMFKKEARVLISRAGGPGRYDNQYEKENRDYPVGYVRWTEGRNVGEYVRLLSEKRISVQPLITDQYELDQAHHAYEKYESDSKILASLIKY